MCYTKLGNDYKSCLNLLNAGKMELMKNEQFFKQSKTLGNDDIPIDEGNPDLPRNIEDVDKIILGNVIAASNNIIFHKSLKQLEKDFGIKMKKINKNQS